MSKWDTCQLVQDESVENDKEYEINIDCDPEQNIVQGRITKAISLNNLKLAGIPNELLRCPGTRELDLSNNYLTDLPEKLFRMCQWIERLSVNNNKITTMPDSIGILRNLKVLNVSNNQLTAIPESIIKVPNLEIIRVENNPLENPPLETAMQGVEAIGKWFTRKAQFGSFENNKLTVEEDVSTAVERVTALPLENVADEVHPLISNNTNAVTATTTESSFDLFISHAWEDKNSVARPLFEALTARGISVWYDESVLEIGDSLSQKIDEGLSRCRYGVVVISPQFFSKRWTQRELAGLVARETSSGKKAILPVWHNVTPEIVSRYSPTLADRLGVPTKEGIPHITERILRVLEKHD